MGLHVKTYIVKNEEARLFIIHGICEHSGRYAGLAKKFNEQEVSVITYDLRGHGQSEGKRGYIKNFQDHVSDFNRIKRKYRNRRVKQFILGHSMGGLIGHLFMIAYNPRVDGYIASGAPTDYISDVKPLRLIGYKWFGFINKQNKFGKNALSKDPQVEEDYNNDPLVIKSFKIRLAGEMFVKGVKYLKENINNNKKPILILHGKEDPIVPYEFSENIYNLISHNKKDIIIYDNMYHEILNEVERDKVFNDIMEWMNEK